MNEKIIAARLLHQLFGEVTTISPTLRLREGTRGAAAARSATSFGPSPLKRERRHLPHVKIPTGLTSGSRLLTVLQNGEHLGEQTASTQRCLLFASFAERGHILSSSPKCCQLVSFTDSVALVISPCPLGLDSVRTSLHARPMGR